jgi:archaellum component FlaF (FlaF/FlaG flagellin family)
LKILIKTDRTRFSLEKNERITISRYQMNKGAENMNVNIPNGLSLDVLLDRTKQLMGGKFLSYSASSNNCGD